MKTIIGREKFLSHFFAFLQQNDFATLVNLSNLVPQCSAPKHHHHQLLSSPEQWRACCWCWWRGAGSETTANSKGFPGSWKIEIRENPTIHNCKIGNSWSQSGSHDDSWQPTCSLESVPLAVPLSHGASWTRACTSWPPWRSPWPAPPPRPPPQPAAGPASRCARAPERSTGPTPASWMVCSSFRGVDVFRVLQRVLEQQVLIREVEVWGGDDAAEDALHPPLAAQAARLARTKQPCTHIWQLCQLPGRAAVAQLYSPAPGSEPVLRLESNDQYYSVDGRWRILWRTINQPDFSARIRSQAGTKHEFLSVGGAVATLSGAPNYSTTLHKDDEWTEEFQKEEWAQELVAEMMVK